MSEVTPVDQWKQFLEETPPNSSLRIPGLVRIRSLPHDDQGVIDLPLIELYCPKDRGVRIFETEDPIVFDQDRIFRFIAYTCRNCKAARRTIVVMLYWSDFGALKCGGDVFVRKLGEFPLSPTAIPLQVQKLLDGANLEHYQKGMQATTLGLGIGAAAYFRRVVENQWKQLVKEMRKAAERLGVTDLSEYDAALASNQFNSAVKSLKNAIPEKLLLPGGHNPLTLLHQLYSRQLHKMPDHECLRQAQDIQLILTALVENIENVLQDQTELSAAVSRLQNLAKPTDK